MIRILVFLVAVLPALALALPAEVSTSWAPVDGAASYSVQCGLDLAAMDPEVNTTETSALIPIELVGDTGTVYCELQAASATGLLSEVATMQGQWDFSELPPAEPQFIEFNLLFDCPEGFECVVNVLPSPLP